MKAAGLSAHQVLAPLLLTAAVVAVISFAFNERIVTRANATLKAWEAVEYGAIPEATGIRSNVYLVDGENILRSGAVFTPHGDVVCSGGLGEWKRVSDMPRVRMGSASVFFGRKMFRKFTARLSNDSSQLMSNAPTER